MANKEKGIPFTMADQESLEVRVCVCVCVCVLCICVCMGGACMCSMCVHVLIIRFCYVPCIHNNSAFSNIFLKGNNANPIICSHTQPITCTVRTYVQCV